MVYHFPITCAVHPWYRSTMQLLVDLSHTHYTSYLSPVLVFGHLLLCVAYAVWCNNWSFSCVFFAHIHRLRHIRGKICPIIFVLFVAFLSWELFSTQNPQINKDYSNYDCPQYMHFLKFPSMSKAILLFWMRISEKQKKNTNLDASSLKKKDFSHRDMISSCPWCIESDNLLFFGFWKR